MSDLEHERAPQASAATTLCASRDHEHLPRRARDLEEALAAARGTIDALSARNEALEQRLALRASVEACVRAQPSTRTVRVPSDGAGDPERARAATHVFDAPRDTVFANEDARFLGVCHVFHQEWFGIRSAAGVLPGHKLAIRADRALRVRELEAIVHELDRRRVHVVVIHAWSDAAHALARTLRAVTKTKLFVVWHGTTTQWAAPEERRLALGALEAARDGLVHGWRAVRRGMEALAGSSRPSPQLLNAPPNVRVLRARMPRRADACLALAPSWNDLRKNLATNLLAAHSVARIARTYYFADDFELPAWIAPRIERRRYASQRQMLELMGTVDVVLNATTIDCHPMVDLEALAMGTPTVRGPLFLDALEDHPYARASVVDNALSVGDVARATERILTIPHEELDGMMADYRARMRAVSLERYAELVGA